MPTPLVNLARTLRFGLHSDPPPIDSTNSFAGHPALLGLAPFLTLTAQLRGHIDSSTGMLVNIKQIDSALRTHAVPVIAAHYASHPHTQLPVTLMRPLFALLHTHLAPHYLAALELALSPYLKLTTHSKDPHMVLLTQRFEFAAAHRLYSAALTPQQNQETFGRCTNPNGHGHNYELEVTLAGTPHPTTGTLLPLPTFQKIVNTHVIDLFDHKHLNLDCPEFASTNPTVEHIAHTIFQKLSPAFPAPLTLHSIRVWETPKTWAEVTAEK